MEREAARALVLRHGWNVAAYQILNPGMRLWFSRQGDAVAGYAQHRSWWVVAGAPVAAEDRLPDAVAELKSDAAEAGAQVIFFGAGARLETLLGAGGAHRLVRLGALPIWDAQSWDVTVRAKASLRAQLNRARNKGVGVTEWATERASRSAELRDVMHRWLESRGLPPLHFMTEPDTLGDARDRRVFVAEQGGAVAGFLVAIPIPARSGWLIEQWPRSPGAPNGTTHLMVDAAMRTLGAEGTSFVTLGMAPLSERARPTSRSEPAWLALLLRWMRAHGRRFYNFRGLDAFKASLEPDRWESVSAILPGLRVTPAMLWAIAAAFGGGSPSKLIAQAVGMALQREARTLVGV